MLNLIFIVNSLYILILFQDGCIECRSDLIGGGGGIYVADIRASHGERVTGEIYFNLHYTIS